MVSGEVEKEINNLFDGLAEKYASDTSSRTNYEAIVEKVAEEFSGGNEKVKSRNQDKAALKAEIARLTRAVKKNRNIRNHKMRKINQKRAKKRASLKAEIADLEQTLKDLDLEDSSLS